MTKKLALATTALTSAKLVVPLGRGSRGKTFWARWAIERAQRAGRAIVVADADRTNPTLSNYFQQVMRPQTADDRDVKSWFEQVIEQQIEEKFSALIDFGGGDLVLKSTGRELHLASFLENYNIQAVAVHLIGPDPDDLSFLRDMENGAFAPEATILVLNESLVPAHLTPATAFEDTVMRHPILLKAVERGAKLVFMPQLKCAGAIDQRRLSFASAEAGQVRPGQAQIGPIDRQRTARSGSGRWRARFQR